MEKPKYFVIIIIILLICSSGLKATYKTDIYLAYINSDMNKWKHIIDVMDKHKVISAEYLSDLLNYQYGYIAWCIGTNKTDLAKEILNLAEDNLTLLERKTNNLSIINSYKSAFYGFRIGINVFQIPFIGLKSIECAKSAIKLDVNNPYGYIQYGNCEFYIPVIFGGSRTEALKYYKKAEELMERDSSQIKNNWNYLSLLTMIARTYSDLKCYYKAKYYYDKIESIEPNYVWVKKELYPELMKYLN